MLSQPCGGRRCCTRAPFHASSARLLSSREVPLVCFRHSSAANSIPLGSKKSLPHQRSVQLGHSVGRSSSGAAMSQRAAMSCMDRGEGGASVRDPASGVRGPASSVRGPASRATGPPSRARTRGLTSSSRPDIKRPASTTHALACVCRTRQMTSVMATMYLSGTARHTRAVRITVVVELRKKK